MKSHESVSTGAPPLRVALVSHVSRPEEINEPLGIETLAGALAARFGARVETRLYLVESPLQQVHLKNQLLDYRPHVVGVSSKIGQLDSLLDLCHFVGRLSSPRPVTVVGDVLSTLGHTELLNLLPEAVCVTGEGENALTGIVECLGAGQDKSVAAESPDHGVFCAQLLDAGVPNCAFLADGEVVLTPQRATDMSLAVAPVREFLPSSIAHGWIIHAEASRGCPFSKCTFCYVNQKYHIPDEEQGPQAWRPMRLDAVMHDLEQLSIAGARTIFYTDEDFVGPDIERTRDLCAQIIEGKRSGRLHPDMAFFISSSAHTLMWHKREQRSAEVVVELLSLLKEAGVREIFLGIESGCDAQLKRYKKGVNVEQNLEAIAMVRASGLELDLGFLPFDPWTTIDELAESLDFLRAADLVHQPVRLMKRVLLTPGTPIADRWAEVAGDTQVLLNDLTLDYTIMDEQVARVAELASYRWQFRASDIYKAQTARRTQLSEDGAEREALTHHLCEERAGDFGFISLSVEAIRRDPGNWREALAEVVAADSVLGVAAQVQTADAKPGRHPGHIVTTTTSTQLTDLL